MFYGEEGKVLEPSTRTTVKLLASGTLVFFTRIWNVAGTLSMPADTPPAAVEHVAVALMT